MSKICNDTLIDLGVNKSEILNNLEILLDNNGNRLDWNNYFMALALLAKQRSACDRLKVGCVIVKDKRLICMGYNGFLPGAPHKSRVRNNHEQSTVHAEINAVSDAAARGVSIKGGTAYVTHYTCINCFKSLISADIRTIYYHSDYKNDPIVSELAIENGVKIIKL